MCSSEIEILKQISNTADFGLQNYVRNKCVGVRHVTYLRCTPLPRNIRV